MRSLVIREEQIAVLSEAAYESFCKRLYEHIKKCWPREFERKGATGVQQSIEKGIARAAKYGIQAERDVVRYIDTMHLVGEDFDVDPKKGWVHVILEAKTLAPTIKAIRIWEQAKKEHLPDKPKKVTR